jgi:ABC-2 type transport system permease protein
MISALAGTGGLIRLILRRDRWLLALWVPLLGVYPALIAAAVQQQQPTAASRVAFAASIAGNSGLLLLNGPVYGSSVGAIATWRAADALWVAALVSLLVIIRHTRTEEETGRRELLGSGVVGRHASLAAALIVVLGANVVVAAIAALSLLGEGLPAGGSIALGLSLAAVGWVFAALAAVTAQLTESAASARGIAVAMLGGTFLLRAIGDTAGPGPLSWLSPIGWAHLIRPFAAERWWILLLAVLAVVVLVPVAITLSARRDVAAGVLPPRPGPATAAPGLRSPPALAWRLHRGALLGWAAGLAVIGGVFGGSAKGAADVFTDNPQLREVFERLGGQGGASDLLLSAGASILGLLASAYATQAALRLRAEEAGLRAEPVLTTAVRRPQWITSHLALALGGPAAALAVAGLATGLVYGVSVDDVGQQVPRVLAGAMVQVPAVWVLAGITVALFGLLPRLAPVSWAALALFVFLWQLGQSLRLNQWLLDTSPFTHLPRIPGGHVTAIPLVWLAAVTAALAIIGLVGFGRRDVGRT